MTSFVTYDYITGYEDGTIRPKNNITRAEFTTILDRIFLEFVTSGIYSGDISGNAIIVEQNVALKDVTINGDLVIPEGIKETLKLKNVLVKGNLVLREKIDISEISCDGKIIHMYSDIDIDYDKYISEEYGIEFSIPNSAKVVEKWNETKINYKTENLLVIDIIQSGDYYLKNIETIAKEVIHNSENIYVISEKGNFNNIKYHLYKDTSAENDNNLLIIKRDNLVYKILFNKITEENLLDNVLGTIDFFDTENITERKNVIYKNSKLKIKFTYREGYIGVDDSYNTNSVYSGDAPIKLFIQVNTITDIQEYSFNEVAYMLKNLAREDGILIKSETLEVYNNDAIKMKIVSEEKLMYSLYVIDNNILYKFIFMSEEEIMNEIGEDLFKQVIASMQF